MINLDRASLQLLDIQLYHMEKLDLLNLLVDKRKELSKHKREIFIYRIRSNVYLYLGIFLASLGVFGMFTSLVLINIFELEHKIENIYIYFELPSVLIGLIGFIMIYGLRRNVLDIIKSRYTNVIRLLEKEISKIEAAYNKVKEEH